MPTAQINDFPMHYLDLGVGTPLVLLHGFPLDSRIFKHQADAFKDRYRVIAPDLRGFGQSTATTPFSLNQLADDVHLLLQQIGASPCILGGLSMGGYVAQSYIRKYPADVKALILFNTKSESDNEQQQQGRNKMIESVRYGGSRVVAEQMLPNMLGPKTKETNPALVAEVTGIMQACPALTIEHALEALRDRDDHRSTLPQIKVPSLIITGESDAISGPSIMQPIAKAIPGSAYQVIPNAGHLSTLENPSAVNAVLEAFLKTV